MRRVHFKDLPLNGFFRVLRVGVRDDTAVVQDSSGGELFLLLGAKKAGAVAKGKTFPGPRRPHAQSKRAVGHS